MEKGKPPAIIQTVTGTRCYRSLDPKDVIFSLLGVVGDIDSYSGQYALAHGYEVDESNQAYQLIPDYKKGPASCSGILLLQVS